MRQFQMLVVVLLTAITVELALVVIKLPTPPLQAAPSPPNSATFTPEDPHDTLKRQLADVQKQIARLDARLHDDSRRLLATCYLAHSAWFYLFNPGVHPAPIQDINKIYCTAQGWNTAQPRDKNMDIPFGP